MKTRGSPRTTEQERTHAYWERNVARFGAFYRDISQEEFPTAPWFQTLYRMTIMRLERQLMVQRHAMAIRFIEEHVRPGATAVDIGCGTGIFTVEMLRRGARVKAVDYVQAALDLTRAKVEREIPHRASDIDYILADITETAPPPSDVAIALGVTPYVEDIDSMYGNILPTTSIFYCSVLDPRHWANRLRRLVPALNVRRVHFFDRTIVDGLLAKHGCSLVQREPIGTGYLDLAVKMRTEARHRG